MAQLTHPNSQLFQFLSSNRRRLEYNSILSAAGIGICTAAIAAMPFIAWRRSLNIDGLLIAVAGMMLAAMVMVGLIVRWRLKLDQVADRLEVTQAQRDQISGAAEFMNSADPFEKLAVRQTEDWIGRERQQLTVSRRFPKSLYLAILLLALLALLWWLTPDKLNPPPYAAPPLPPPQPSQTNASVATQPDTSPSSTTQPSTTQPGITQPSVAQPSVTQSNAAQPGASAGSGPSANSPSASGGGQPASSGQPSASQHADARSGTSQSGSSQSGQPQSSASQAGSAQPGSSQPDTSSTAQLLTAGVPTAGEPNEPNDAQGAASATTSSPASSSTAQLPTAGVPNLPIQDIAAAAARSDGKGTPKPVEGEMDDPNAAGDRADSSAGVQFTPIEVDSLEVEALPPQRRELVIQYFRSMRQLQTAATTRPITGGDLP